MNEELKINKDIDIKFTRLSKPILNNIDLPLSGVYNSIDNTEYSNFPLKNKFKNFCICPPQQLGPENIFQLNNSFGKLLTEEIIEGLIILTNTSPRQVTIIKLEIFFNCEEKKSSKDKNNNYNNNRNNEKFKKKINISLPDPNNSLFLSPKQSYSIKIRNFLPLSGKYTISIFFSVKSDYYNQLYNSLKLKSKIRENTKEYIINKENEIEIFQSKVFSFYAYCPFEIKEIFRLNQMKEEYFIEINIKNISKYMLTLPFLVITPKIRINDILKPLINLEEIQDNENEPTLGGFKNNTKALSLQPEEEVNIFFASNSSEIFLNEENFVLSIQWLNIFDLSPKTFEYEFKNGLNIFNKFFIFKIVDRPMGNIIQHQQFPIIFQFITKRPDKDFTLVISEYKKDEDEYIECKDEYNEDKKIKNKLIKGHDDINIIIKEYKIEINQKMPKTNVNILCKSDKLGIVSFPKIHIILYVIENNSERKIDEYIYSDFLSFNCVQNVQLI